MKLSIYYLILTIKFESYLIYRFVFISGLSKIVILNMCLRVTETFAYYLKQMLYDACYKYFLLFIKNLQIVMLLLLSNPLQFTIGFRTNSLVRPYNAFIYTDNVK